MVLGVAAAMAMMLVAFVAPAMAQTNEFNDSERYGFASSSDSEWNDHNDRNDHNDYYFLSPYNYYGGFDNDYYYDGCEGPVCLID